MEGGVDGGIGGGDGASTEGGKSKAAGGDESSATAEADSSAPFTADTTLGEGGTASDFFALAFLPHAPLATPRSRMRIVCA